MKILLFYTFALVLLHSGSSLRCYKCNDCLSVSSTTETCRDVDPASEVASCLIQKVRVGGSIDPMVIKKCAIHGLKEQFKCPDLPDSDPMSCNVCQGDFCNAATPLKGASTIFMLLLCVSALI